jgi:hypothetical protein
MDNSHTAERGQTAIGDEAYATNDSVIKAFIVIIFVK